MLKVLQDKLICAGLNYNDARRYAYSICLMIPMNIDDRYAAKLTSVIGSVLTEISKELDPPGKPLSPENHQPAQIEIDGVWHTL